ncbi:MAG: peptidoglycan-binding protein, partial [Acidimicrobiia bacterium]|nr:peptidoglycan-binding protein [Acidimicrobiia bacterium]
MTKELRLGDSGEAVRDLHRRLVSRGYPPFAGDVFDEITDDAVRSFQTERGLR